MNDLIRELQSMIKAIRALPDPIAYIVLDHNCDPSLFAVGRDAYGNRYILASPSWLDEVQHVKVGDLDVVGDPFHVVPFGVATPLYRRESMPPQWPDQKMKEGD